MLNFQQDECKILDNFPQNDFDAILKTLNVENSNDGVVEESKITALEEVSKNGKKRVQYVYKIFGVFLVKIE